MKEWMIRIGCVFLGVIITLGTSKIIDMFGERDIMSEVVIEEPTPSSEILKEIEETETKSESEPEQNFALEAELKFQELANLAALKKEAELEKEPEVQETPEFPPNSIEAAPVRWKKDYPLLNSYGTIEDKLAQRSSYEETMAVNAFDKIVIANSTVDFSDVKIAIIGDSITAGSTLPAEEQGVYDWPSQLRRILGCKEVINMGIGGSTVSCCVDHFPMCKRWSDVSKDCDIIIVMGGSNDMLFEDRNQFGELEYSQRMVEGTFCGDLDDMLSRMRWVYRDHNEENYTKLIYINPPSTVLNDGVYAVDPDRMVRQAEFANAINTMAPAYQFEVIDMYNNNLLNTHDADINAIYAPDGIHYNKDGYAILAEHVASQIIQRIDQ